MAATGYLPVISQNKRKKTYSSYCETFRAWQGGDAKALDSLLAQGYDRLFMPKAVRVAQTLPPKAENHPKNILDAAWGTIATQDPGVVQSFSHFLQHLQVQLEHQVHHRLAQTL